jgi:Flp pilus assembly protein TadG
MGRFRERGQGVTEFAIAIPVVMLLIVGLLDIGRLVYIHNALAEGAREGARYGAVQGRATTAAGRSDIADEVAARMAAVPDPTVTVSCEQLGPSSGCASGDIIAVRVTTTVAPITPVISDLVGPLTFTTTARMTIHN